MSDATRTRDLDDIRALLKIHRANLDMDELREYFAMLNRPELLNFSDITEPRADAGAVLAREAGVPFHPPLGVYSWIDPIVEWLSLMQMLCPVWPVRERPMQSDTSVQLACANIT